MNIDICQKNSHFFQIAVTPKRAGLMWTSQILTFAKKKILIFFRLLDLYRLFFTSVNLTQANILFKKSPHQSSLLRSESNLKKMSCFWTYVNIPGLLGYVINFQYLSVSYPMHVRFLSLASLAQAPRACRQGMPLGEQIGGSCGKLS